MTDAQDVVDILGILDEHQISLGLLLDILRDHQKRLDSVQGTVHALTQDAEAVWDILDNVEEPEDYVYDAPPEFDPRDDEFIPFTRANLAVMSEEQKDAVLND